jgi:hypothetical protein
MMVFTLAQTTSIFQEPNNQMAIPAAMRAQLATEGTVNVDDLAQFDAENLKQIADNLRRPSSRVGVDPDEPDGATMPTPPFVFGAKSLDRLKPSSELVRYYEAIGRDLTAANIRHLKGHFFGVWSNSVVRGTEFLRFGLTIRHF